MFESTWVDWLLVIIIYVTIIITIYKAGYCTTDRCLVGIKDNIYDLTTFLDDHPGSPETLTENTGCDATTVFLEIGHSTFAEGLLTNFSLFHWELHNESLRLPSPLDVKMRSKLQKQIESNKKIVLKLASQEFPLTNGSQKILKRSKRKNKGL